MAFDTGISSAVAQFVYTQSNGNVTEPVNGSYIQALCEYFGITEPLYNSWLIALCDYYGITEPLNGSYTIALANYFNITYPTGGTWWMALSEASPTPTDLIWDLVLKQWQNETTPWATADAPISPLYLGPNSFEDSNPVLTGVADPNNYVSITIDSKTYLTQADGLGDWSQQVGPLVGGADPGNAYQMSLVGKDPTTGLESDPTLFTIDILEPAVAITFELRTQWSLYWYYAGMQVEKEVTPGVWEPIEWEGNPTWDNGAKFYKVQPFINTGISDGYQTKNVMTFRSGDESGATTADPIFRDIILDKGFNYRIVAVDRSTPNTETNYGRFNLYTVLNGATILLPQYDGEDVDWLTGNVQQTFSI